MYNPIEGQYFLPPGYTQMMQYASFPDLQPAIPDQAPLASRLIYLTMKTTADHLFGMGNLQHGQQVLESLFRMKSNRFSYQFTQIVLIEKLLAGLVVAYPGKLMKSLELPMAWHLLKIRGLKGFLQFFVKALPLAGIKEAEDDEYFISNLAVLPEQQGRGLGSHILTQTERKASALGFKKISLTVDVDNDRARKLYERVGFAPVKKVFIESFHRRIGYTGFYRMRKELA
jgi:ribosomal protein S18 acetylase RimI-like enzyme